MMKKSVILAITLGLLIFSTTIARGLQGPPLVGRERHVITGYVEPNTPGAPGVTVDPALVAAITDPGAFDPDGSLNLNKAIYVRHFDRNRSAAPDAILVIMPGWATGANSSSLMADEIVRLSNGRVEVRAVDRRSNLLEDLLPMIAAENTMTTEATGVALAAYQNHPAGTGGFIAAHPFSVSGIMAEWGLDVHMRDLRAVIEEARAGADKVILAGHSLGAVLAQMFAAYDFGDAAGFELIDGLVILDATADPTGLGISAISDEVYLAGGPGPLGPVTGLNQLRNPTAPDHSPFISAPVNPILAQLVEIGAQAALIDPDGPSLWRAVDPERIPVPATNAAAIGIVFDDEFQELNSGRWSIGFLAVPPGGTAGDVATRADDPAELNPNGLWRPKMLASGLQRWAPLKDLSSIGLASGPEQSDFDSLVRAFLLGTGDGTASQEDANFWEWYFPRRVITDMAKVVDLGRKSLSAEVLAAQQARGGNPITVTENRRVNIPLLAIRNSEGGIVPSEVFFRLYARSTNIRKVTTVTMQNYAHGDMLTSLEKRSDPGGKNIPELVIDFLEKDVF